MTPRQATSCGPLATTGLPTATTGPTRSRSVRPATPCSSLEPAKARARAQTWQPSPTVADPIGPSGNTAGLMRDRRAAMLLVALLVAACGSTTGRALAPIPPLGGGERGG